MQKKRVVDDGGYKNVSIINLVWIEYTNMNERVPIVFEWYNSLIIQP